MLFLALVFLLGGSARDDALSLIILRPFSVMAFMLALWLTPIGSLRANAPILILAAALPTLILIQLIPLPPSFWGALPGRELAWRVGELAGTEQPWRPLSLAPYRTWNSFFACFAPLACLLLTLDVSRKDAARVMLALASIILISAVFGLLQTIGGSGNGFYLYRVTNPDSAVGLLANRNHHAMLLAVAFPLIAAIASMPAGRSDQNKAPKLVALAFALCVIPFLLVTQSRAGILLGIVGAGLAAFVYKDPTPTTGAGPGPVRRHLPWIVALAAAAVCVLGLLLAGRDSSLQRLVSGGIEGDLRFRVWPPIVEAMKAYFPVGSGFGTFDEVYRAIEPDRNLSPRYLNHAHNDWLELVLTGGLPGLLLVGALMVAFVRKLPMLVLRSPVEQPGRLVVERLGLSIIVILAAGSAYDYPLRVPSLACLFAIGVGWMWRRSRNDRAGG